MTEDLGAIRLSFQSHEIETELSRGEQVVQAAPLFTEITMHITVLIGRVLDQIGKDKILQYLGQNWISVDERLPKDGQYVLTWRIATKYRVCLHRFTKDDTIGDWWMGEQNYFVGDNHITHWAELPEGPNVTY